MALLGRIMGIVACVVMIAVGFGGLALISIGLGLLLFGRIF